MVGDLKKWLDKRKLEINDLIWMVEQLRPKRADKPVKSKKPLQPGGQGLRLLMSQRQAHRAEG